MQEEVKHYKVKSLKTQLRPNSVYYVKATSQSSVKTYITDQTGFPFPLVDLQGGGGSTGAVQTVTGTGVTGTPTNPVIDISTFKSSDLGNLIELSTNDGKLFVKPITSPDGSIDISSTASALEIQLSTSLQTQIQNALQSGDNISELNNDAGYITLADIPFSSVAATAWTPNHITATGNPYLTGTLVYYLGHIFQANFNNDSITPAIGGNLYWTDLGVGYLIDQEQTDWLAVSGSSFIKNKPTNVSSFINDSGYLTSFTETDPVFSAWLSTNPLSSYLLTTVAASTYLPIPTGTVSQYVRGDGTLANFPAIPAGGLPPGGTAGQILTKVDAVDYNATWQDNYADWTSVVKHIVKNNGVALITKGTPVYSTGSNGTNILVGKASNTSEATSSKTMGLMQSDITTTGGTQTGFVITEGLLGGLNTAGQTAGDPVWLGANGALIYGLINKPYAPAHLVFIGIVTKVSAGNGEIFVKVQNGFELEELHNIDLKTTVPVNGHILGFNGTLWVNKTIAGWLGGAPLIGANNGLNVVAGDVVQLGGELLQDTTINGGASTGYNLKVINGDLSLDKGAGVGGARGNLILNNDRSIFWGSYLGNFISANSTTGNSSYYAPSFGRHEFYSSIKLVAYGAGAKTGTATYNLSVNAAGDVIETPIVSASTPIKLTSQTLTVGSWTLSGGYYTYSFSNANIDTTCDVSVTPQNASYQTAYNAQILPFINVAAGVATFYSQFPPQADIVVDIVITQTT
jgi:hypothetical protein